jgi:hypothetical protein
MKKIPSLRLAIAVILSMLPRALLCWLPRTRYGRCAGIRDWSRRTGPRLGIGFWRSTP